MAEKWTRAAPNVYRRGRAYQVRLTNPQTGKKETFGPSDGVVDRQSALRVRDEKRVQMRNTRRRGTAGAETIGEFYDRWLRDFPRAASTNMHYRELVSLFVTHDAHGLEETFAEGTRVRDLRFDQFSKQMARRYTLEQPSRARAVSAMFSDALQDGLLETNPFFRLGFRRNNGRKQLVAITRDELDLLAECARKEHGDYGDTFEAMVLTAAWTGIRPGELFALRWADIDWKTDSIFIRRSFRSKTKELIDYTKNGDQREIVLPAPLRDPLRRFQGSHDPSERPAGERDNLFATRDGKRFYNTIFQYYWNPVRTAFRAKVEERDPGRASLLFERADGSPKPMDFYELRHFCATYLLERGVPAHQVAVQLGHTDNGALVMSTYGHPSQDAARDAVRAAFGA